MAGGALEGCIRLLKRPDLESNRKGLQSLLLLTMLNSVIVTPAVNATEKILYGGSDKIFSKLRNLLLSFMCDDVQVTVDDEDASVVSALTDDGFDLDCAFGFDEGYDSEDEADNPCGRHWGALHSTGLRVISNCLAQVPSTAGRKTKGGGRIDFTTSFWKKVIKELIHNVEVGSQPDVLGYSLRCIRLLHKIDAKTIGPLLQYTLLPYLSNLTNDYTGEFQKYPLILDESMKLLEQAS